MSRRNPNDEGIARGSSGAPLLAGLMIGGLVGAGAMLLLAPQAGRQTRAEIQDGAMEIKDRTTESVRGAVSQAKTRAQQMASDVRGRAADLQNQGKDIAIDQLDRVASAAQSGKKSLQASKTDT
jgi:gas vesicle protein